MTIFWIFWTGLFAGSAHVVSGPDHLAAVAPLAAQKRGDRSWWLGLQWGLGHAAGAILVGILAVVLRQLAPVDLISSWSERLVGIVLIAVGLWGVRRVLRDRVHTHEHDHGSHRHTHIHFHLQADGEETPEQTHDTHHRHGHAALGIGLLHGLAGGSHFLAVLPALAFPTLFQAFCYLAAYGLGSVLAMVLFALALGRLAGHLSLRNPLALRGLMMVSSLVAVGLGGFWLVA